MLALWIPMTDGTLDNKGLSEVYIKNKGAAAVSNDGNMGKCYYLDGTSYMTLSSNMMEFIKNRPFSFGCWFKTSGSGFAESVKRCGIMAFTYGCSLYLTSTGFLQAYLDNGTTLDSITSTKSFFDSEWHHLFYTYDGINAKLYADGELVGTKTIRFKNRYSNDGVIGTETNNASKHIANGYICDVRVYDECLPNKMVKLLAQGLYLHYPMNQIDRERNFLLNSAFTTGNKFILQGNGTEGGFRCPLAVSGESNDTYTVSLSLRGNANMNCYLIQPEGNFSIRLANKSDLSETYYKHFSLSFTIKSGYTLSHIYICTRYGDSTPGDWFEIKPNSLIFQKGIISNPVWTPAWEDENSWLDITEYDTSGYCNNGQVSILPIRIPNSPRYDGCYKFNSDLSDGKKSAAANYIENTSFILSRDTISICYWRKRTIAGYNGGSFFTLDNRALSLYDQYGITSYDNNYMINLIDDNGLTSNIRIPSISPNESDIGGWEFHALTFDGITAKVYINGELYRQISKDRKHRIASDNERGLTIGYSKAGNGFRYFNGYMSDFRVYGTCLSDDDIRKLYNASASITNTGTLLLAGEMIEK